jgi:UDP-N-acetylglucosamine:LPS N-acetylglucosamine transferase
LNRQIDLIYIDSGGGHRAAATALAEVVRQQQRPWDLRMSCIQELLDSIDFIQKSTGIQFQEIYNIMLRRGWTLGTAQMIPLMHALIRAFHREQVRVLEDHWRRSRPDMVVSLIPHYNRALKQALDSVWPGTPYVTIMTDIADYPPHFWIERQDQYVVCGSQKAAEQARALGLPDSRILRSSGMILDPKFYRPMDVDRRAERIKLGLKPDLPTGLVMFGGEGSLEMTKIARLLDEQGPETQLILMCGKNEALAAELRGLPRRSPMFIQGFTKDVPYFMEISDFFIGKPGPGSISEALAMKLPVIVANNAWTLAHERYNAEWIEEQGAGIVVSSFSKIAEGVRELLAPERYSEYRRRAAEIKNYAVYEIPCLLEDILDKRMQEMPMANPKKKRMPAFLT